jgi:hypothetical protein
MKKIVAVLMIASTLVVGGCTGYHGGCVQKDNSGC